MSEYKPEDLEREAERHCEKETNVGMQILPANSSTVQAMLRDGAQAKRELASAKIRIKELAAQKTEAQSPYRWDYGNEDLGL